MTNHAVLTPSQSTVPAQANHNCAEVRRPAHHDSVTRAEMNHSSQERECRNGRPRS